MESAIGGTHTLFCHIGTSATGRWVVTRQFSVVPHFKPGGDIQFYGQLPPVAQLGLQQQLMQLNHASGGVARDLWAMSSCWNIINRKNFAFMLQCLPTARMLAADKGAVAELGPKPTMLYHLTKDSEVYVLRYKLPVSEGHRPSDHSLPYEKIDLEVRDVISSLVWDANGNDPNLTRHPWALHSVWKLQASQGLAVILEWQPVSTLPRVSVVGGNATPVAADNTFVFTPMRSSSVAEVDETTSINAQPPRYEA